MPNRPRLKAWDWFIAYIVPQPVWAWWMRNIYGPIRNEIRKWK